VFSFWFFGGSADGDAVLEFWSAKEDFFECLVSTLEVVDKVLDAGRCWFFGVGFEDSDARLIGKRLRFCCWKRPLRGV